MGYDRGNSFPLDSEPNGIPNDSKSKVKLSPRSYPIICERKWNTSFLSVKRQPDRKNVTDRLVAVRETGVSRHHGCPIEGPLTPLEHHGTIVSRGSREADVISSCKSGLTA